MSSGRPYPTFDPPRVSGESHWKDDVTNLISNYIRCVYVVFLIAKYFRGKSIKFHKPKQTEVHYIRKNTNQSNLYRCIISIILEKKERDNMSHK